MFNIGILVFASYIGLLLIDEIYFHRRRSLHKIEKTWRLIQTLSILYGTLVVLLVEYSDTTQIYFIFPLLLSVFALTAGEKAVGPECSSYERYLHSWIQLIHPLMLIILGAIWPFIHGVSFFLDIVIPFKTTRLKPLCVGYIGALIGFFLIQISQLNTRIKKQVESAVLPKEYPKDTFHSQEPDPPKT